MNKAVILAAGRGTRMGTLTDDLPKAMLQVGGKPVLEHILDRLRRAGLRSALIVTGYRAALIEDYFSRYPLDIRFRRQEPIDGTATAALLGRDFTDSDDFLLTYGDIFASPSDYCGINALMEGDPEAGGVVGVKHVADPCQGAAVYEKDGQLISIVEKPPPGTSSTNWNSAGLYAFRAGVYEFLAKVPRSQRGEFELTTALEFMIAAGRRLLLYALQGDWRDVGRPEDLEALRRSI